MNKFAKAMTGAAAAALVTIGAAAPAQAQYYDRYDRDRGIDVGDIVTGVAIAGAAAAAIGALSRAFDNDGYRGQVYERNYGYGYDRYDRNYGYNNRYGSYGSPEAAVNVCAREAQRIGGRVEIRDIDRTNGYYRVKGRVEMRDYNYGRWNRGYDVDRESFTCYARDGRIYDFRI